MIDLPPEDRKLAELFNEGYEAISAKNYARAIGPLTEAAHMDPQRHIVLGQLGHAQTQLGLSRRGNEGHAVLQQAITSLTPIFDLSLTFRLCGGLQRLYS